MSKDFLDYIREMVREYNYAKKHACRELTFTEFLLIRRMWYFG